VQELVTTAPTRPTPARKIIIQYLEAISAELDARQAFRDNATPENLTTWTNAKNNLEDRKRYIP
jgi:hypothetical protein